MRVRLQHNHGSDAIIAWEQHDERVVHVEKELKGECYLT